MNYIEKNFSFSFCICFVDVELFVVGNHKGDKLAFALHNEALEHIGEVVELGLNLLRIYILATTHENHGLAPTPQEDVVVGIDGTHVARVEPTVLVNSRRGYCCAQEF